MRKLIYPCIAFLLLSACNNKDRGDEDALSDRKADSLTYAPDGTKTEITGPNDTAGATYSDFNEFYSAFKKALKSEDPARINRFIHPELGSFVIFRPGAIDNIKRVNSIEEAYKEVPYAEKRFPELACELRAGEIPEDYCRVEYQDCIRQEVNGDDRVSRLKQALTDAGIRGSYPAGEKKQDIEFGKLIHQKLALFPYTIGLSFIKVDGRWYLGIIDTAQYSCSA